MKFVTGKLATLLLTAFPLFTFNSIASANPAELVAQNYRVLSGRVHKILETRLTGLNACTTSFRADLEADFKNLPRYSENRAEVVKILELYLQSYREASGGCRASLDQAEKSFQQAERKKFSFLDNVLDHLCKEAPDNNSVQNARSCRLQMHQVFSDLDPHCISLQVPNSQGFYDPFPCLAADYLIGKSLVNHQSWRSFLPRSHAFISNLHEALSQPTAPKTGVDLWNLYLQENSDQADLRESFLAEIALYFSSSNSEVSYITGFHDHIWSFILFETQSPENALDYFITARLNVDMFQTLVRWAKKMHIDLKLHGIESKSKNRHDYMAAYLACHYRKQSRVIHESVPILLGYAYESFDFKSHMIDDHDSFKAAKENFVTDTTRYRTGTYWGYQFCEMKF